MKKLLLIIFSLSTWVALAAGSKTLHDASCLNIVFPQSGDTLNFGQVRFSGSCLPDANIWFNGKRLKVYPTGAFVGIAKIEEGWNSLIFRILDRHGVINDTVRVFHKYSPFEYPEIPTSVEHNSVFPLSDLWVSQGEKFHAGFWGSPNGTAFLSIPGMAESVEVPEVPSYRNGGKTGFYQIKLKAPRSEIMDSQPLFYNFQGKDGHSFKFTAPGQLKILSPHTILVGVTNDSINLIRKRPAGKILYTLPPGLKMRITGKYDNYFKVQYAKRKEYFIHQRNITVLPGEKYPYSSIGGMQFSEDETHVNFEFEVSGLVPFEVKENTRRRTLEVSFYRSVRAANWVMPQPESAFIKKVSSRQKNGAILVLKVQLEQEHSWGYEAGYEDKVFKLKIKKAPIFNGNYGLPLAGLTLCVDPGHGGEYLGGVSPTGMREEDANLEIALEVSKLLTSHGARVILTRNSNTTLSLSDRVRIAQMTNTDIFVSIHNNSIPINVDPMKFKGTSVYYSHPQSYKLAKSIYKRMTGIGLNSHKTRYAPFVVTRQTNFLSVLVEAAFLTHPEDEMLLLSKEFKQAMAGAIVEGVMDFLAEAAPDSMKEAIKTSSLRYFPSSN